ncbi:MAG: putative sulfate exporter family transporter [Aeromicrobium sp.]
MNTHARRAVAFVPAAVAASIAVAIGIVLPLAGPLLIALVLGAVAANTAIGRLDALTDQASTTKLLLRLGVVMLGLQLPIGDIAGIGISGIVIVLTTVLVTYAATVAAGDRLGLDRSFVTLLAAGFCICGAAAIVAVQDAVRAKEKFVALAVGMVTLFGSLMIVLVPWLSDLIGLREEQAAVWAGASIHEVAQVVAAAAIVGPGALAIATTVKLGRVALLAPMYAVVQRRAARIAPPPDGRATEVRVPLVPWFVMGFAVAVAIRSAGVLPLSVLDVTGAATTFLLAAGMFGLGLAIRLADMWPVPARAVALSVISTAVAAGTSLLLIITTS